MQSTKGRRCESRTRSDSDQPVPETCGSPESNASGGRRRFAPVCDLQKHLNVF